MVQILSHKVHERAFYIKPEEVAEHLVNQAQQDGFTPVHYACFKGNIKMLELLISMHGDIRAVSVHGVNCLHLACQKNQLEMVKYLINTHKFSPTDIT